MLQLNVIQGPDRGKRFELPEGEPQLIGRSSEALPISDNTVSRRHAELTPDDGCWWVRDLESSNGTFINGELTTGRVKLAAGDQIRCGSTLLLFAVIHDEDRPSPVKIFDRDVLETTVEKRIDPNEDSMILAVPDPIRAATEHLRVVYELMKVTSSCVDRHDLLDAVMDLVIDEFEPDRGFVLLQESPSAAPEPAAVRYKVRPKTRDEGHIPVSRTIVTHTLTRREGVLSTNAMNDTRFRSGDSVQEYGIRSAMCVPIRAGDHVYGVIHVDSSIANFTFTEGQLRLLDAIAQHTGLALRGLELVGSKVQTERLAAIGQTVASISHAVKNILQGLRGGADAVELAINKGDLELAKEAWPILGRNLDRIYALTLNMLTYSKQRSLDIELTNFALIVEEVAELIQPQCDRKRAGLVLDLAEDMPPVPMDGNAIHQVLMNLLTNAVEAVAEKRGLIAVTSRYNMEAHEAELTVTDNGPGIPAHRHAEVFEAFRSTKGQRGTGLGLAVSRRLVEEHGGRIELESAEARGATVTIILPCERGKLDAGDTRLPRPLAASDLDELDESGRFPPQVSTRLADEAEEPMMRPAPDKDD